MLSSDISYYNSKHRSVVHGDFIYHIGGKIGEFSYAPFEEWKYDSVHDNFTVSVSNTLLHDFFVYPETFIVNAADYVHCI